MPALAKSRMIASQRASAISGVTGSTNAYTKRLPCVVVYQ